MLRVPVLIRHKRGTILNNRKILPLDLIPQLRVESPAGLQMVILDKVRQMRMKPMKIIGEKMTRRKDHTMHLVGKIALSLEISGNLKVFFICKQ